ncbi:MAG: LacI family DNA-binding transcriptional regulator [Lentisphaerota bacterium]
MAGNTVTILDVAKLAGVSPSAVSKVLNGKSVLDATREKVLKVSRHLGYQPNAFAQGIRRSRCGNIGIVIFSESMWFHDFVFELLELCTIKSIVVMVENHIESEETLPKFLSMVDGLIILDRCPQGFLDNLKRNGNPPVITIDEILNYERSYTLGKDHHLMARKSVEYLVVNGHKNIKLIAPTPDYLGLDQRVTGFRETLIEFLGKCNDDQIIFTPSTSRFDELMQFGYDYTVELIKSGKLPTALVYATDKLASGGIVAIKEAGIRVPEDLSVISFSSNENNFLTIPLLTTIVHDTKHMAKTMLEQLLKMVEDPKACGQYDVSVFYLVNRGSVRNLNLN